MKRYIETKISPRWIHWCSSWSNAARCSAIFALILASLWVLLPISAATVCIEEPFVKHRFIGPILWKHNYNYHLSMYLHGQKSLWTLYTGMRAATVVVWNIETVRSQLQYFHILLAFHLFIEYTYKAGPPRNVLRAYLQLVFRLQYIRTQPSLQRR